MSNGTLREKSELDGECTKRRRNRKTAPLKTYKKQKKTTSLSLDDVFGTYSTDDESTKHSRSSIVPSLFKEKNEEVDDKKLITKIDETQKSRNGKEKTGNIRRLSLKKERKKGELEESDEDESDAEGKKIIPWKTENKQFLEKSMEKKVAGKKRFSKSDEVGEATAVITAGIPEKKKQKAEKSLVEISMFQEGDQKQVKTKTPTMPEQKKKGRKPTTNGQFEKKLAKNQSCYSEEQHEEQKREAAEAEQKNEKLQGESQRQKVERAGSGSSDDVGKSDVTSLNDRSPETVIQTHKLSNTKSAWKRHLKVGNSEEMKRSRKELKSPNIDVSQMVSDSYEGLKTGDVATVKQEPLNKVFERFVYKQIFLIPETVAVNNWISYHFQSLNKNGANNMKDNASKPESKSDSLFDSTNIDFNLLQSVKVAVTSESTTIEMEHMKMDHVSKGCLTNASSHSMSNECCSPQNLSHDKSNQSKKCDLIEQKLVTDKRSIAADNVIVPKCPKKP
ncbi:hypothetical protein X798_02931 [Onchocerca flexuosa]|uniref:Uncharacterized protein n=1 Tax=Onchocerca flexuosa TaxID=387005 RepID=A0A238BXV1_9BILA|nr:hypothetical protein X798_02931 [Onchocerca flexuosa]